MLSNILALSALLAVVSLDGLAASTPEPRAGKINALHTRSFFYIEGQYANDAASASTIMHGQMYVEHLTPQNVQHALPLVLFHGLGQSGTNWLTTPDGRTGWADYFLSLGWDLYIVDQPARARSAWIETVDGVQAPSSSLLTEQIFTATQNFDLWPQAHLHTQWPGSGFQGDAVFDQFFAAQMPSLLSATSAVETDQKILAAGTQLLDKIGPAILLTHSQAGQFGWILADARPQLVKAILAIEPNGPPFQGAVIPPLIPTRAYGLTDIPIAYTPPINSAADLVPVIISQQPNVTCFAQAPSSARKLTNISKVPVLVVTSESSFHAPYDNCTVNYLKQGGVAVDHVPLATVGIHGNGHMMFMEKNNLDIVDIVLTPWLKAKQF